MNVEISLTFVQKNVEKNTFELKLKLNKMASYDHGLWGCDFPFHRHPKFVSTRFNSNIM